jgi:hypothetical protein
VTQSVGSFPVDLDDPSLPPIVHQFGDTRHRHVTYTFAAHSRFREFFDPADPEAAFLQEARLDPVHVLSTVRPTAPVVLAVTPAALTSHDVELLPFVIPPAGGDDGLVGPVAIDEDGDGVPDGEDTDGDGVIDVHYPTDPVSYDPPQPIFITRRQGGILRVELARPWFTTGAGEQVGVVVSPAPGVAVEHAPGVPDAPATFASHDNEHAHLVTTAYRDPLVSTATPAQPDHASLTGAAGAPLVVLDTESGTPICVVPFDVFSADGRWFADIGFGTLGDRSDQPMVRLSLVRFQRHSLRDLTTSPIVTCDLVPLLGSRELRSQRVDDQQEITLSRTGIGVANPVELRLEAAPTGTPLDVLTTLDGTGSAWTVVQRFTGVLGTPFPPFTVPNDGGIHRVVVLEFDALPPSSAQPVPNPLSPALSGELDRRTVFVAIEGVV